MRNRLFGLPFSLVIAFVFVLGALFYREFFHIGKWIIVAALVAYVIYNLKFAVWVARTVRDRGLKEIFMASIVVVFAMAIGSIIMNNPIPFFMIALFLACDYLIKEKKD